VLSAVLFFAVSVESRADITGFFETHVLFLPQTTTSEIAPQFFDIENDLTANILLSGMRTTFHTHFGIAGIEDVIINSNVVLGVVELNTVLVFARFASGSLIPFYPTLHFLKKQVTTEIFFGGISIENVATVEDTAAFISQTTAYAFGDIVTIVGSTPSGITVASQTSICKERVANVIKKHVIAPYSVNPHCATEPKPDLLFDFDRLTISNVPIAPDVSASAVIDCVRINACVLTTTFTITGGAVPFQTQLSFRDALTAIRWNGATITFSFPSGTVSIIFGADALIAQIRGVLAVTLNPAANPADFTLRWTVIPGLGLTDAVIGLAITRGAIRFSARADYGGGPPLRFEELFFDLTVVAGRYEFRAATRFEQDALVEGVIDFTVFF
jgi:hypothetical protein